MPETNVTIITVTRTKYPNRSLENKGDDHKSLLEIMKEQQRGDILMCNHYLTSTTKNFLPLEQCWGGGEGGRKGKGRVRWYIQGSYKITRIKNQKVGTVIAVQTWDKTGKCKHASYVLYIHAVPPDFLLIMLPNTGDTWFP